MEVVRREPGQTTGMMNYVLISMIIGMLTFGGLISAMLASGRMTPSAPEMERQLLLILLALGGAALGAGLLLRPMMLGGWRRKYAGRPANRDTLVELLSPLFAFTLIPAALAEGVGLFGVIVLMISGSWVALAAPVLATVVIASLIVTEGRARRFVELVTERNW